MELYRSFLLIVVICVCFVSSEKSCENLAKVAKGLCKHHPGEFHKRCVHEKLKRSSCTNSCQFFCENNRNNDCQPDDVTCERSCIRKCSKEPPSLHLSGTGNFSTVLNVHNIIENVNNIHKPVTIQKSLNNVVVVKHTEKEKKEQCCQILVPTCKAIYYYQTECYLEMQERCGRICEDPAFSVAMQSYQRFLFNYFYNNCYYHYYRQNKWCRDIYNWYYNQYIYYNWWKGYYGDLRRNSEDKKINEGGTITNNTKDDNSTDVNDGENNNEEMEETTKE